MLSRLTWIGASAGETALVAKSRGMSTWVSKVNTRWWMARARASSESLSAPLTAAASSNRQRLARKGRTVSSVTHGVDDVVDGEAVGHRRHRLRVTRIVSVFPGIAEVHVVVDHHHQPALVVVDATPARRHAVLFVGHAVLQGRQARDLDLLV